VLKGSEESNGSWRRAVAGFSAGPSILGSHRPPTSTGSNRRAHGPPSLQHSFARSFPNSIAALPRSFLPDLLFFTHHLFSLSPHLPRPLCVFHTPQFFLQSPRSLFARPALLLVPFLRPPVTPFRARCPLLLYNKDPFFLSALSFTNL
jgi:hypothetical protein